MITRAVSRFIAGQRLAMAIVAVGLILTATASWALAAKVADDRRAELDSLALQARTAIERRVASYAQPLFGMSGVLSGAKPVGRAEFHRYVEVAGTARRQPGLLAYTFNRFVPAGEVSGFEQAVKADTSLAVEGYPGFRVFPSVGVGTDRVVVDLIEPLAGNEPIFGFDVTSDPARRQAVEAARDSGRLVATGPVKLIQKGGEPGFLMYLPVYRTDQVPETAPARRRRFVGVVTAAVSLDRMLADVLGGTAAERPRIHMEIQDVGATLDPSRVAGAGGTVLLDTEGPAGVHEGDQAGSRSLDINVGGRRWRLIATAGPDLGSGQAGLLPWLVGTGGVVLTALLAGLVVSLSGAQRRAMALADDMTTSLREREDELRGANAHLAKSNAALDRADQVKDAFLGTVSHELRTPLTAISGFARLLADRWERLDPDERRESLTCIGRSSDTLSRLLDDLLEFNRTGDQAPALSMVTLDLAVVAQRAVDELGPLTTTHNLRLETERVDIRADRVAVTRIITNLVTNAVKFSPDGSTVTVTARCEEGMAVLEVADQGPGVPSDEQALVFERFYRGSPKGSPRRPGTGIGLAVVKDLTERLGGSVHILDGRTGGAVFRVELPLETPPPREAVSAGQPKAAA